jgi:hypothetical protein
MAALTLASGALAGVTPTAHEAAVEVLEDVAFVARETMAATLSAVTHVITPRALS